MTRSRAGDDGVPSPLAAKYYAQRATAGLIISEATYVSPEGVGYPCTPGIHSDGQLAAWRNVTRAVHSEGGRIFLQLWHVGRVSHPCMQPGRTLPIAPSAIAPEGQLYTSTGMQRFVTPRRLGANEIPGIVDQFAQAAQRAKDAGFDGVDLHAANGYLIDQFLRDGSNRRVDHYGGSVFNRARFLLEIVEAVAACWGADRIGVRVSPLNPYNSMRDSDPLPTFCYVARALSDRGVGYLHVAEPGPGHPLSTTTGRRLLVALRAGFRGTLIVDGGRDRASAEAALGAVGADLVALATPFIANPDLIDRLARGIPLSVADPKTFYNGGERGYTDYPPYTADSGDPSAPAVMNG
jgi:N-ethylmaleimide reductase